MGTENSSHVWFKHARVRVRQSNGEYLPEIQVDYAEIRVLTKGLSDVILTSQALTLEDAYRQILPWLPVLGKTEEQLKNYLAKVDADYSGFDDPNFGAAPDQFKISWYGKNQERYAFILPKGWNEQTPVRMQLHLSWNRLWKDRDRMTYLQPIPPPEGYENEPIQVWTKGFGPDDMSEMRYAKGLPPGGPNRGLGGPGHDLIEMNEDGSPGRHFRGTPVAEERAPSEKQPKDTGDRAEQPLHRAWIWWMLFGVVFPLCIGLVARLFWKKRKA